ncbi:MAG: pilus assembly protein CpaC, partial [Phenylobacterium sp.]|nr:pilus assembly protein CpaC [Phenylobacterium sp.]
MITLRPPLRRSALRGSAALVLGALAFFASAEARSAPQGYVPEASVREVTADSTGYGGQLALPVGGSRILRFSQPIGRVLLGEPKVGDVIPLGERTLYVLGKAPGTTSLTVLPRGGGAGPMATLDVRVGYDVDATKRALHDIMPTEPLEVSARGEGMVLTGLMSSSAAAAQAAAVAEQYAPGHVLNLTSIRGAEQVMLSVRVAEVQRTALQQLGLNNINALWDTTGALNIAAGGINADAVANLLGRTTSGKNWTIQALFDALERKGFASTLAEPNLVALSGETAVFFAGGEFPIPVPQLGAGAFTTITIEYKQYGVSIGFTPTVYGDTINLLVAPEVSALDPANSVQLQGFRIPGLTTRRAKTTVELRNGQSFAIAGLIRREFSDSMRGLPGASSLPIFGSLFRSTGYQNNETEVVIIVTAQLAKPTDRRNLLVPTDLRQGPDAASLYLG